MCEAVERGIHAASVCEVRGCLERVDALCWRTVKRRERRGRGGEWWTREGEVFRAETQRRRGWDLDLNCLPHGVSAGE